MHDHLLRMSVSHAPSRHNATFRRRVNQTPPEVFSKPRRSTKTASWNLCPGTCRPNQILAGLPPRRKPLGVWAERPPREPRSWFSASQRGTAGSPRCLSPASRPGRSRSGFSSVGYAKGWLLETFLARARKGLVHKGLHWCNVKLDAVGRWLGVSYGCLQDISLTPTLRHEQGLVFFLFSHKRCGQPQPAFDHFDSLR